VPCHPASERYEAQVQRSGRQASYSERSTPYSVAVSGLRTAVTSSTHISACKPSRKDILLGKAPFSFLPASASHSNNSCSGCRTDASHDHHAHPAGSAKETTATESKDDDACESSSCRVLKDVPLAPHPCSTVQALSRRTAMGWRRSPDPCSKSRMRTPTSTLMQGGFPFSLESEKAIGGFG